MAAPKIEFRVGTNPDKIERWGSTAISVLAGLGVYQVDTTGSSNLIAPPNWEIMYNIGVKELEDVSELLAESGYLVEVPDHVERETPAFILSVKGKEWVQAAFTDLYAPPGLPPRMLWHSAFQTLQLFVNYAKDGASVSDISNQYGRSMYRLDRNCQSLKAIGCLQGGERISTKEKRIREYAPTDLGFRMMLTQRSHTKPISPR